jgi:torulene dioxygenase
VDALADFDASKPTKWYVVDRKHRRGVVAKYDVDPYFCFHTINAWEEPSPSDPSQTDIIIQLPAYENLDIIKRFDYDHLKSTSPTACEFLMDKGASTRANIHLWRLPSIVLAGVSTSGKALLDFSVPKEKSCELPTMNPRFVMKPSRYIYGAIDRGHSTFMDGLVRRRILSLGRTWP